MWQPDDEHPFQYQTPTEDTNVLNRTEGSAATGVVLLDACIGFILSFVKLLAMIPSPAGGVWMLGFFFLSPIGQAAHSTPPALHIPLVGVLAS